MFVKWAHVKAEELKYRRAGTICLREVAKAEAFISLLNLNDDNDEEERINKYSSEVWA